MSGFALDVLPGCKVLEGCGLQPATDSGRTDEKTGKAIRVWKRTPVGGSVGPIPLAEGSLTPLPFASGQPEVTLQGEIRRREGLWIVTLFLVNGQEEPDRLKDEKWIFQPQLVVRSADDRPVFVYFGRYGCGYCDKTNKEAFSDAAVKAAYTGHYVLAYVDAESGKRLRLPSGERITERELGTRYDAFVTPVFSFLTADGEVLGRLVGVQRIVDLMEAHEATQARLAGKTS